MASPVHRHGRSARDIANVMQKLQGWCESAYSHRSTSGGFAAIFFFFRGDPVARAAAAKESGEDDSGAVRHISFSSADS